MLFACIITNILAIALPSLRISPLFFIRIATIGLLYGAALSYNVVYIQSIGSPVGIFSGLFIVTLLSLSIGTFCFLVGTLILMPWSLHNAPQNRENPLVVLFTLLGGSLLLSSTDLVSMYLIIELQFFAVYVLATLYKDSESATSVGFKYILLGGLSSWLILLGCGLIYTYTGLVLTGVGFLESICSLIIVILTELFNFSFFGAFTLFLAPHSLGLLLCSVAPIKPADETNLTDSLSPKKRSRLSKAEREQFSLSQEEKEILVGLCLGDANINKRKVNARIKFEQGTVHEDYLLHLYERFKDFCLANPKILIRNPDKITGVKYSSIRFITLSLPCFNEFYDLFYPNGQKIVPLNIEELLTVISLAYWIADDGTFHKIDHCVVLCTESFNYDEVQLLVSALANKFGLKCTINKRGSGFRIRISAESLPKLQNLLKDIMPPMMLHKIGL